MSPEDKGPWRRWRETRKGRISQTKREFRATFVFVAILILLLVAILMSWHLPGNRSAAWRAVTAQVRASRRLSSQQR